MRVAVFVDAGYLYAQGSSAVTGLKRPKSREAFELDTKQLVDLLKDVAKSKSGGRELLRIYWYDGAPVTGASAGQTRMGQLEDVKLRLGQLNSEGQQKGVDSLIVTDLMELARNKAILDAIVVTGDEDIRVGVQIAQSLGVRVHLLGIGGAKSSQSFSLLQEADTVTLWGKSDVATFLNLVGTSKAVTTQRPAAKKAAKTPTPPTPKPPEKPRKISTEQIAEAVDRVIENLSEQRLIGATKLAVAGKQLPGPIVALLKAELLKTYGSALTKAEHKSARDALTSKLKGMRDVA